MPLQMVLSREAKALICTVCSLIAGSNPVNVRPFTAGINKAYHFAGGSLVEAPYSEAVITLPADIDMEQINGLEGSKAAPIICDLMNKNSDDRTKSYSLWLMKQWSIQNPEAQWLIQ